MVNSTIPTNPGFPLSIAMFFLPSGSSKSMLFAEKIDLPSLSVFCDPLARVLPAISFTCRARIRSCNHVIKIEKFDKYPFIGITSAYHKSDLKLPSVHQAVVEMQQPSRERYHNKLYL